MPACTRGSPPYAIASTGAPPPVGFRGRACRDLLDSLERVRPLMVVGHQLPSSGSLSGGPAPRRALLVRRLGSRVRRQSSRPFYSGSLVGRGVLPLNQPSCHPPGASPLSPLSARSYCGGVYGQQHGPVVYQKTGWGDILRCAQPGGATPPSVGRNMGVHVGSLVHHQD